ncbi:hypothetical protein O3M35_004891 [Rhynocoris fuscipes]|uniref:Uncharacterized protein n=1 Tax=Rhynocoris fuscipes TaxID=488301 RepID=A0AAW1DGR7_9HEMI
MATRSTRSVKKIEKPKPLKITPASRHSTSDVPGQITLSTLEDIMLLIDTVITAIGRKTLSDDISYYTTALITKMKIFGQRLEELYKDQLDKAFCQFRNASKDDSVDTVIRINLLQLIELRAMQWNLCASVNAYYLSKCCIPDVGECNEVCTPIVNNNNILAPGEIIKSSGKYSAPTKVPGKNYYKDEVVIRNADSGKVSPGAKERNVQITGPEEEKIVLAKQLIEDTIKRNASPIREIEKDIGSNSSLNSTASDDSGQVVGSVISGKMSLNSHREDSFEYKHTVVVAGKTIKLSSSDHDSLKWAKLSLETAAKQKDSSSDTTFSSKYTQTSDLAKYNSSNSPHFNDHSVTRSHSCNEQVNEIKCDSYKNDVTNEANNKIPIQTKKLYKVKLVQYTREFLLDLSSCGAACQIPPNWDKISTLYPAIVKQLHRNLFELAEDNLINSNNNFKQIGIPWKF